MPQGPLVTHLIIQSSHELMHTDCAHPSVSMPVHALEFAQGAYKSGKPGNVGEFCKSGKLRENSGNLKCTQGIFGAHYYQ